MSIHTRRRVRLLASVAALSAGALAFAGCASGSGQAASSSDWKLPTTDPTATIHVLSTFALDTTTGMQEFLDKFHEDHPTITVKYEVVPFDSLNNTVDSRVGNKSGSPDLYWADQPRIAALAARGEAEDLTAQFSEFKSSFDPASYESGIYQDKLYALPMTNSTQLLFYNKDLVQAAGLTPPSADPASRMTWEQLDSDALKAKAAGAQYGFMFEQVDRYYQLEPLALSKGGSTGVTGDDLLTPDITSQQWIDAMTWYGKTFADGASARGIAVEQTIPDFLAGKTAYFVDGPWLVDRLKDSTVNWGVALHPQFAGGEAATPDGSWSVAMNPFSKEKEAAGIFMKAMTVDNGYVGDLPANVEGKKEYFGRDLFSSPEGQIAAKIIDYETSNTAVNRPVTVGYLEFESILNTMFADIRNGSDPKTALEKASDDLTKAWAKYKK
jgi:ABC-type glycerol-3-phosphate transport system substrate-binding protein